MSAIPGGGQGARELETARIAHRYHTWKCRSSAGLSRIHGNVGARQLRAQIGTQNRRPTSSSRATGRGEFGGGSASLCDECRLPEAASVIHVFVDSPQGSPLTLDPTGRHDGLPVGGLRAIASATTRDIDKLATVEAEQQVVDLVHEAREVAMPGRRPVGRVIPNELKKASGLERQGEHRARPTCTRELAHPMEVDVRRKMREN